MIALGPYVPATRAEILSAFRAMQQDGHVLACPCGARRFVPDRCSERDKGIAGFMIEHAECDAEVAHAG